MSGLQNINFNPMVIGLIGNAGSGKSTLANRLSTEISSREPYFMGRIRRVSFSTPVKNIVAYAFGLSPQVLDEYKNKPLPVWPYVTTRELFQQVGTDMFRDKYPDIWVNFLLKSLHEGVEWPNNFIVIVDDVRFENEAEAIKKIGGLLIKIETRLPEFPVYKHSSETELNKIIPDVVIHRKDTHYNVSIGELADVVFEHFKERLKGG